KILDESNDTGRRLRALWALHVTGGITEEMMRKLLDDGDLDVRAWAVQLACEAAVPGKPVVELFAKMAVEDPSPVVRLYLASALQRLPLEHRWAVAEGLLGHETDADDHNLPLMIWYGVEPLVPGQPARALELGARSKIPQVARFIVRRTAAEDGGDAEVAAREAEVDAGGGRGGAASAGQHPDAEVVGPRLRDAAEVRRRGDGAAGGVRRGQVRRPPRATGAPQDPGRPRAGAGP